MVPTFKLADTADINTLIDMMRNLYAHDHLAFDEQIARNAIPLILSDPSFGKVWLIQFEGEAIGYVVLTLGFSLEYRGRDAFIDELYIRESHRGLGLGKKVLQFVEEACRSLGVRALHLEVERANTNAQMVYRKAGFVDHDRFLMTKWITV
jgi:GNAT superfamily N-acetyltransferase